MEEVLQNSGRKILIWECLPYIAGGQRIALQITYAIRDHFDVIFLLPRKGPFSEELESRYIQYHTLPMGEYKEGKKNVFDIVKFIMYTPMVFIRTCRFLKKEGCCLLYVNSSRNFIWSSLLGYILSIPVVWHVHHIFLDKKSKWLIEWAGQMKCIKKILFVSNSTKEQFSGLEAKSEVIYNGIDRSIFNPVKYKKQIKDEFGISQKRKLISLIAWILPTKRQDILVKAIPHVLAEIENVHFLFVGGCKKGYEYYYRELQKMIEYLRIGDHVTFTGHREDIPLLLKEIDINILTGSTEGFSLALLEGWASGVPTITPNIKPFTEFIKHEETGLLYDFNKHSTLAQQIILFLKDNKLRKNVINRSLEHVKQFDISIFNNQIRNSISEVLNYEDLIN